MTRGVRAGLGQVGAGVFAEGFNQLQHSLLVHHLSLLGIGGCGLEFDGKFLAGLAFLGAAPAARSSRTGMVRRAVIARGKRPSRYGGR